MQNISDAKFNKNYLTAKCPERARFCSPALLNLNSSIATTSAKLKNSENAIISDKNVLTLLKTRQHKVYLGILISTKEKLALRKPITLR